MSWCTLFIACGVVDVHSTLGTESEVTACHCTDRSDVHYTLYFKLVTNCTVIATGPSDQRHCSVTRCHCSGTRCHCSVTRCHSSVTRCRSSVTRCHSSVTRCHCSVTRCHTTARWLIMGADFQPNKYLGNWGTSGLSLTSGPLCQHYRRVVGDRGVTVVKVLRYKSEGRWSDSRWYHWNFSLT